MADVSKEADEKFEQAIREYLEAKNYDDGLLMDWVLITSQHMSYPDGESGTALSIHVGRHQPLYRSAGLIEYARCRTAKTLTEP